MKVFEKDGHLNFVDDANCFVGMETTQCCCEDFGWWVSTDIDGPDRSKIESDLEGFSFDKEFFRYDRHGGDGGHAASFRLHGKDETKYLHIYNDHNGYYCHGFKFCETRFSGDAVLWQGDL